MNKLWYSLKKELQLLFSDKVGLSLLFGMPILLVFIITIVQDSAYKIVNENKITILVSNQDQGAHGQKLVRLLDKSGLFNMQKKTTLDSIQIKNELLKTKKLTALYIPKNFSQKLEEKASKISNAMLSQMGVAEASNIKNSPGDLALKFYHDPILTENYCQSLEGMFYSYLAIVENKLMISTIYKNLGITKGSIDIEKQMQASKINIESITASNSGNKILPNSSQHNVPAWTIFAMFFMVTSLGSNIAKEKTSGSFVRLKTLPTSFSLVLIAKMLVYLFVAFLQVFVIFSIGIYLFPLIELPRLGIPSNPFPMLIIVLLTGLSAVSYALLIGTLAKTQEQANGFGAISIILFGAIGGIWVPTFVMPNYMQLISNISPLHWCLEGFYTIFLKQGSWSELGSVVLYLITFITICQLLIYLKLKTNKLI